MDTSAFLAAVPGLFEGDPLTTPPRDPRWAQLAESVAGFTGPNELAVLALAAQHLPPDECYLEVGTFKGRSTCAAVQDAPHATFVALENFLEFGMLGRQARAELLANLEEHARGTDFTLIEGDCFKTMTRQNVPKPVGVYFFDGEHTALSHYLALAVVEPLLADEAVVLVDDATWPLVQRAHERYIARHPGWEVAARWDASRDDDPLWSNGLHALVYRRPPGAPRRLGRVDELLRRYQVDVQDKVNTVAWNVVTHVPGVQSLLIRLAPKKGRRVGR